MIPLSITNLNAAVLVLNGRNEFSEGLGIVSVQERLI